MSGLPVDAVIIVKIMLTLKLYESFFTNHTSYVQDDLQDGSTDVANEVLHFT
jgi:hypothetical protein